MWSLRAGSGQNVLGAQCACLVGEGLPALSGALVDGNWDLVDVLAGREERRAALGLVGGEADGHQVQPGSGQGQAPAGGDVDHGAGHAGAVPAQDHRGCGVPGVGVHHVDELVQDGVVVDGVDQEQPSRPGVSAGLVGAGGRGVRPGVPCPVHGVHGIGQHLCDRVAGGLRGIVGVDPVGVEGGELAGDADAGDVDAGRPRVARDLGGEVAGEVLPVGGVPGDGHVQVLDVEQPQLAVVTQADGHQQGVGGGLVGDVGADKIQGGVPVQAPVVAVRGATPRLAEVGGGAQVEDYGAVGELDRGDHGQGLLRDGTLGRKPAEGAVHELHGGRGARADGDHGLLDRSQQGLRPGHRVPGPAVAELGAAPAAQQEQHRPGQEGSGPAQPGQDPPGRRTALIVGVGVGGRRPAGSRCRGVGGCGRRRGGNRRRRTRVCLRHRSGVGRRVERRRGLRDLARRVGAAHRRSGLRGRHRRQRQGPADVDLVRVDQVDPTRLPGAPGGLEDLRPPVSVPELALRDRGEGVPLPDRVVPLRALPR